MKTKNETCNGEEKTESPYLKAGWFSRLTFWWVVSIIAKANRATLTTEDVYDILPEVESKTLTTSFQERWTGISEKGRRSYGSLFKQLLLHFKKELFMLFSLLFVTSCIRFVEPFLIVGLMRHLSDTERSSDTAGYVYMIAMVVGTLVKTFCSGHYTPAAGILAMNMRSICLSMVYKKVLKMSIVDSKRISSGRIITLMSNDVESFHHAMNYVGVMFTAPFVFLAFFVAEYFEIGYLVVIPIVCIGGFIGFRYWTGKLIGNIRLTQELWTDKRVQLMSEIITGMRIVKIFCWENMYMKRANELRRSEMVISLKRTLIQFFGIASNFAVSKVFILVTLTAYIYIYGTTPTVEVTIKMIALFKALYLDGIHGVPVVLQVLQEATVATERIKEFLLSEDLKQDPDHQCSDQSAHICITGGFSSWNDATLISEADTEYSLQDINLSIDHGKLIAVVGPVGASKSSLLMMILGELPLLKGQKEMRGTVGYVPQESWLLPDTVRKNIIFDQEYEEEKYRQVVKACALDEDIAYFPQKDLSLIGERGLCLSGGQKARVNLARAIYQDTDAYLLDDPLSALDTKVGKDIFQRAICGLLKSKLRILVTHQLQYLPHVDEIIIMDKGKIKTRGAYDEIIHELDIVTSSTLKRTVSLSANAEGPWVETKFEGELKEIPAEKDEIGSVSLKIYLKHISYGMGKLLVPPMLLCMVIAMGTDVCSDWMLSTWYNGKTTNLTSQIARVSSAGQRDWELWIIWLVVCGYMLFVGLYNVFPALILTLASKNLYNKMFNRVLHAPSYFFETNPVGQVLNRFSRDTYFMDVNLQLPTSYITQIFSFGVSYAVYVCVLNPWMILPTVGYVVFILIIGHVIIGTILQTKRLEASLRSPLFSHLSTTIQGLPVIRAFRKDEHFLSEVYTLIDNHTSAWYMYVMSSRFLGLCIDLPAFVCVGIYLSLTLALFSEGDDAGATALSLIYLLNTFVWLQKGMKMMAEVECMMTSVERINQYATLEQEAAAYTDIRPPNHWPSHGNIQLNHMSLTYKDVDTPALGPISLTMKPCEKVGIVGRTGAGKSSLITSLLRMVEPAGSIKIDGVEITSLGLTDVRSNISVIPQDPLLFAGTLRRNMDCFDEYSDEQIWRALQQVQLTEKVKGLSQGLYEDIGVGGGHFSVGQRQLLCMARALLRKNKIVIIDEATANVDNRTDSIIQETLGREFSGMTLLTVAHRLNTIIKYDKILVLEKAQMVQFDHPHILLQDTSGLFYQMLKSLGEEHFNILRRMAHDAFLDTPTQSTWL